MKTPFKQKRISALVSVAVSLWAASSHAAVPSNPYSYAKTVALSYDSAGRLSTTTVEPDLAEHCSTRTLQYDGRGNVSVQTMAACVTTPADKQFPTAQPTYDYGESSRTQTIVVNGASRTVTEPAGLGPRQTTDSAGTTFTIRADVRFGVAVEVGTPQGPALSRVLDDLGREVKRTDVDGTQRRTAYCILPGDARDLSTNSDGCTVPEEAPADAIVYVETQGLNSAGNPMSAWTRVFYDAAGRPLRSSSTSFDGSTQPAAYRSALVVQDVVYRPEGPAILSTQPYFFSTGSSGLAGSNDVGLESREYDTFGRVTSVYTSDPSGSITDRSFGAYGSRPARRTQVQYAGLKSTATNDKGQSRQVERNGIGNIYRVTDAAGAQIAYRYDAFANLITVRDALDNRIEQDYDVAGNLVEARDPNRGTTTNSYDAANRLRSKSASLQSTPTTFTYDAAGRLTQRVEPEFSTNWVYDSCLNGQGRLCSWNTSTGVTRQYAYSPAGQRTAERTDVLNGPSFAWGWEYSAATGRLLKTVYPTGVAAAYSYTPLGFGSSVSLTTALSAGSTPPGQAASNVSTAAGKVLWRARTVDARGGVESNVNGAGDIALATRDPMTGRLISQRVRNGTVLDFQYQWDSIGNLVGRVDGVGDGTGAVTETFTYGDNSDPANNINRLTEYTVAGPSIEGGSRTVELRYNALGMLLHKSDLGDYRYGPQGPTAIRPHSPLQVGANVLTYDAGGNVKSGSAASYSTMKFNSFFRPDASGGVVGNNSTYSWLYAANHSRLREQRVTASGPDAGTRVQWYLNPDDRGGLGFEREENSPTTSSATNPQVASNRHYISAFGKTVATVVTTGNLPSYGSVLAPTELSSAPAVKLEYWHTDHLGSLAETTDNTGAVTGRYAYDPYGKRRHKSGAYDADGSVQAQWGQAAEAGTGRGFTGHEHLDDVGLVNMNGRLFDAKAGLFVQADPIRGNGGNSQNYAAYGYALNNPLNALDPTGFDSEGGEGEGDDEGGFDDGGYYNLPDGGGGIPLYSEEWRRMVAEEVQSANVDEAAKNGVAPRVETTESRPVNFGRLLRPLESGMSNFVNGWSMEWKGNLQSWQYQLGMGLRGLAHHAFDIPEDFSRASAVDYGVMAAGLIPFSKLKKLEKLSAVIPTETVAEIYSRMEKRLHLGKDHAELFAVDRKTGAAVSLSEDALRRPLTLTYIKRGEAPTGSSADLIVHALEEVGRFGTETLQTNGIVHATTLKQLDEGVAVAETVLGNMLKRVGEKMGATSVKIERATGYSGETFFKATYEYQTGR